MTDKELYKLCQKWGRKTLQVRYRFEGLLPEVNKRRLYEKRGFESIYVFAAKLAGLNREQVNKVLRLEKRFEHLPGLHAALTEGDVSSNKLVRIASIATPENQDGILAAAKNLSKAAIDAFVQDYKNGRLDGLPEPLINVESLPGQRVGETLNGSGGQSPALHNDKQLNSKVGKESAATLVLDQDIEKELFELQVKGIDINKFLREALERRRLEIASEKEKLAAAQMEGNTMKTGSGLPASRYIPVKIVRLIRQEHGTKCSVPHCQKPAKVLHHTARFALTRSHDPRFLAPLCEGHHQLAHRLDLRQAGKANGNP